MRVRCPQCESEAVAKQDQIGTSITCDVCLEEFLVEPTGPRPSPIEDGVTRVEEAVPASALGTSTTDPVNATDSETEWLSLDDDLTTPDPEPSSAEEAPADDYEFTVTCPLCATRQSVTHLQVGRTIKCPDCFSSFPINNPASHARRERRGMRVETDPDEFALSAPVERPKYLPPAIDGIDLEQSEAVPARPADDLLESEIASSPVLDALRKAEEEVAEEEKANTPALAGTSLTVGVFEFLAEGQALLRWGILSVGFQIGAGAIFSAIESMDSGDAMAKIGSMLLFAFFAAFGLVWFVSWAVVGLAIMRETAEGNNRIENWAQLDIGGWFSESLHIAAAFTMALAPGLLLGQGLIALDWLGPGWWLVATCTLSVLFLFPVFLMANLETDSLINIASGPVFRSLFHAPRHWLGFFLISSALLVVAAIAWQLRRWGAVVPSFLASLAIVGISLIYFRVMGRLTWVCQEETSQ